MKILHVITDLDVGGAEVMLYNLVKEHYKNDNDIHVVGLVGIGEIGVQIRQLGIPVTTLGMQPGRIDFSAIHSINKLIKSFNPDVIQSWMYHADLIGSLAALVNGQKPVVWGLHHTLDKSSSMKPATYRLIILNAWLSHWLPTMVVCCSNATFKSHIKQGYAEGKMVVIANGIDLDQFQFEKGARPSVRKELGLDAETRIIGMFARFHPQKDHHTFILAAEHLHQTHPDVHFILAGRDILPTNLKLVEWIESAGLKNHIHLLGLRSDIPRLASALDIFSLSSIDGEALPVSICEAMACEIPCVVTDVGDSRDIVGQTGLCLQPGNPVLLSEGWEKIISLDTDEIAFLGRQARQRIVEEYNLKIVAEKYYKVYLRILNKSLNSLDQK